MTLLIRPENDSDRDAVWNVNQQAFGNDAEANLVDALRDGRLAEVSLVAEIDGQIVGHILFSRMKILWKSEILESLSLPRWQCYQSFSVSRLAANL
jgi:putative acetyltransferase